MTQHVFKPRNLTALCGVLAGAVLVGNFMARNEAKQTLPPQPQQPAISNMLKHLAGMGHTMFEAQRTATLKEGQPLFRPVSKSVQPLSAALNEWYRGKLANQLPTVSACKSMAARASAFVAVLEPATEEQVALVAELRQASADLQPAAAMSQMGLNAYQQLLAEMNLVPCNPTPVAPAPVIAAPVFQPETPAIFQAGAATLPVAPQAEALQPEALQPVPETPAGPVRAKRAKQQECQGLCTIWDQSSVQTPPQQPVETLPWATATVQTPGF